MLTTTWLRMLVMAGCAASFGGGSVVRAIEKPAVGETFSISEGPALPSGRGSHAGGSVGGRAVVAGGTSWNAERTVKSFLDDSVVFADGKWSAGPALPHPVSEPAFASDGKSLFVVGGRRSQTETNDTVHQLREADGKLTWNELPKLPAAVTAGAGGIVDGRLVLACGQKNNEASNQTLVLDLTSDKPAWREAKPLPGPERMYPAMFASGKFLYLLGGMRIAKVDGKSGMEVFQDAYRYDPKADAWEKLPDLPAKGYCWAASPIDDKSFLLTGVADGTIHNDVWRVNLNDMRGQQIGTLVIQSACAPLVPVNGNTWWLIGGEPDSKKTRTPKVSVIRKGAGATGS